MAEPNLRKDIKNLSDTKTAVIFSTFTAVFDNTTHIEHGLVDFVPSVDKLVVLGGVYNSQLTKLTNYSENADNLSIDLLDWSLSIGEIISFELYKNSNLNIQNDVSNAVIVKTELDDSVENANITKTNLKNVIDTADLTTYASKGSVDIVNSELANMPTQDYIIDKRLISTKLTLEDADANFLGAIAGTGTFNLLSVPQNLSVASEKTNFMIIEKNKVDMSKRSIGMVVGSTDGTITSDLGTGYDSSDYTPVLSGITYFINIKCRKYALYNTSKIYVSGLDNTAYGSVTFTPTVDGYVRYTTGTAFVATSQLEIGTVATTYEKYSQIMSKLLLSSDNLGVKIVDNINIKDGILTEDKVNPTSSIVIKKVGKNLLDMSKNTIGYYVDYSNGNLVANVDNQATDYVPLLPNTAYTISNQSPQVGTKDLVQLAFYNSLKVYVSGLPNTGVQQSITFTTGATVYYMRSSIPVIITDGIMIEKGSLMSVFEPYAIAIAKSDLPSDLFASSNIIAVKKDGTGDFTTYRGAKESITDASENKHYEIQIYEGTFDVLEEYSVSEVNDLSFIGFVKPNFTSIKGIGDKNKIILKVAFPSPIDVYNATTKGRVSALCTFGTGNLENITVTGENCRYGVHDDYDYPNSINYIKNCDFIKYLGNGTNYGGEQSWGEGSWDGQSKTFEDCSFYTEWNYFAYTTHNTLGETQKSYHKFINCKAFTTKGSQAMRFSSLDGQVEEVNIIGMKNNMGILVEPIVPYTGNKYELKGYGNDIVPVKFANTDGLQYAYEFIGETKEMYNGETSILTKGTLVYLDALGTQVKAFLTSTLPILFYGIVSKDIAISGKGIIKTGGYLAIADTSLTGLVIGDKIGVVSGVLAKVTTGDYIGVVTITDYIKLN